MTRVLLWTLAANVLVAGAKIAYGASSGSLAIRADGFHSLLDGVNNVVALIVARFAARPPDSDHPYGHRKFEVLGSLAMGVMILWLVVQILGGALERLGSHPLPTLGREAYLVMLLTLGCNLAVAFAEHRYGRRLNSPLLIADARHTLSDVFVTSAVLAGVVGVRAGFPRADSLSALAVLVPVGWVGYGILRRAVASLADEVVIPSAQVVALASLVDGVRQCDRVRSRGAAGEVRVDLVIRVDSALSVGAAHAIADQVEEAIRARWQEVADVVVHVEPASA